MPQWHIPLSTKIQNSKLIDGESHPEFHVQQQQQAILL